MSLLLASALLLAAATPAAPPAAPVWEYPIHADGGIVYDPLRREAEKTGQLAKYADAETIYHGLALGGHVLTAGVPREVSAYDVAPIPYTLIPKEGESSFPLAVEAVAFEDNERRGDHAFDLAMPNRIALDVEFAGSITAQLDREARHNLKPDMSDTPKAYPPFNRAPLSQSGVIEAGDLVWIKLRYTNSGDTILDPEGYGGALFYPQLLKKNDAGGYEVMGTGYNLYFRDTEYLYPGETHEMWFHLASNNPGFAEPPTPEAGPSGTPQGFGIAPGEYKIRLRLLHRRYVLTEPFLNIWEGAETFVWEWPFTVEDAPRQAPVRPGKVVRVDESDKRTTFIHTFEEFMTAFDCHLAPPADGAREIHGVLHLQVAPWTKHIVLKLVGDPKTGGASVAIPVKVKRNTLGVAYNAHAPAMIASDGLATPVIASQTMADMRTNIQIGPFPDQHIRTRMKEMMDCGINMLATTSMPWLYTDFHDPASNYQGDAWKYALEVARDLGMAIEGWGTYPFDRSPVETIAETIIGEDIPISGYTLGGAYISHAEPGLPRANAIAWLYQFHRWGDLYHQDTAGVVPISVEDTRGWMRQDINIRYEMGAQTAAAFRDWLREQYETIEAVNAAWGASFASFEAIEPEANQVRNAFGHIWEYTDPSNPFHDWSAAIMDLDRFRTSLRVRNYADTLAVVREGIPNAAVCLRTEGGNVLVSGIDPADPNPHLRHVYYSQRRCGAIAEILQAADVVKYHSDYTTMPYTPSELRELIGTAVEQGITPGWFPQFDNMRDIAINARYGTDYQTHYNLPEARKGYMMHALVAVFPWFKATHEAGGVPGILWEDYQCDGFATETQKREMRLFREELARAMDTPEALESRRAVALPDEAWRKGAKALRCYTLPAE